MIRRDAQRRKLNEPTSKTPAGKKREQAISDTLAELDRLEAASPKATAIIGLFRGWLADESGYDEQTWPKLKKALDRERTRIGSRRLFDA